MSKLSDVFNSLKGFLHHGPSMAQFHEAMIEAHDALEARIKAIEDAFKEREAHIAEWFKNALPVDVRVNALKNPQYDVPKQPAEPEAPAEPVAADPAIKPDSLSLQAQPDPVSAAPTEPEAPAPEPEPEPEPVAEAPAEPAQGESHDPV